MRLMLDLLEGVPSTLGIKGYGISELVHRPHHQLAAEAVPDAYVWLDYWCIRSTTRRRSLR